MGPANAIKMSTFAALSKLLSCIVYVLMILDSASIFYITSAPAHAASACVRLEDTTMPHSLQLASMGFLEKSF